MKSPRLLSALPLSYYVTIKSLSVSEPVFLSVNDGGGMRDV